MSTVLRAIVPKIKSTSATKNAVMRELERGMQDFVDLVYKDFRKTVSTWRGKPNFEKNVKAKSNSIEGEVKTDNEIYLYVSGGTRVRYATMSRDWKSKTRPGSLQSGSGRGRVLFVDRRYPRPGIEARKFDEQIANLREKDLNKIMNDILKKMEV